MAWDKYKKAWMAEHPDEKLPKTRFQIMVEFMKEKFEMETETMKSRCEEYRETRLLEAEARKSESDVNTEFQK